MAKQNYALLALTLAVVLQSTLSSSLSEQDHVRNARAIGGRGFRRGDWPWLVLLRATIVTRRIFGIPIDHYHLYCGGVLISNRWIVTAAHCFTENGSAAGRASNWEARMASARLRPTVGQRVVDILGRILDHDDYRQWEIDVDRIILHPDYSRHAHDINDDIALVKLRRSIPNVDSVGTIPLPNYGGETFPSPGMSCVTKGWGCTRRGGSPSTWAQQVEMPVLPDARCERVYGMTTIGDRVCAGHVNEGIGVCLGDSGGPLVCRRDNNSNYTLAGIVSFTSLNRPESFPAVYTKVQSYTPWIQRTMNRN